MNGEEVQEIRSPWLNQTWCSSRGWESLPIMFRTAIVSVLRNFGFPVEDDIDLPDLYFLDLPAEYWTNPGLLCMIFFEILIFSETHQFEDAPLSCCDACHGCHTTRASISFAGWKYLRSEEGSMMLEMSNEQKRERGKDILKAVFNALLKCCHLSPFNLRLLFPHINLAHTEASMRGVFFGRNAFGQKISRQKEIVTLNLAFTNTSSRAVATMWQLSNLQELYLDSCKSLQRGRYQSPLAFLRFLCCASS
jgi:hypothetical protein